MNIREAIKIYNELKDDENVIKYSEALSIVLKQLHKEPKKQFYKSSKSNDFYIELPKKIRFDDIIFKFDSCKVYLDEWRSTLGEYIAGDLSNLNSEVEIIEDEPKEAIIIDSNGYVHTELGAFKGRKMDIAFANRINKLMNEVNELTIKVEKKEE